MIVARRSAISCGVISAYRSEAEHSLPLGRRGRFLSTENPGPKYSVRDSRIELALEGGDPRGKVISVSFQLDALFLAGRKKPSEEQLVWLARAVNAPVSEIRPEG